MQPDYLFFFWCFRLTCKNAPAAARENPLHEADIDQSLSVSRHVNALSDPPVQREQMRSAWNQRVVQSFDHFPERNVSQLQVTTLLGILVSIVSAQRWVHLQNKTVICLKRCKMERLPLHLSLLVGLITHCQTSTEAALTSGINWTQTFLIITKRFFPFRA